MIKRMCAVAAAGLALATACVVGTGTGPAAARAGTAQGGPAASREPGSVLLINGDRLMIAGHSYAVTAGGAGSVLGLSAGGQHYEIPADAIPYLGHGLDLSLFNVSALAARETAGALPVRVSYTGAVPKLPGVIIRSAGDGVAEGYLTADSAMAFGAALARAHAGGGGLLPGGVTISLAGTVPAQRQVRPWYVMHTLTVDGTDLSGKPDTGGFVAVFNVDDPAAGFEIGVFYDGVAKFSVPAGNYWAVAGFNYNGLVGFGSTPRTSAGDNAARLVVLPQFSVSGNTTVMARASAATSEFAMKTPLPAVPELTSIGFDRVSARGVDSSVSLATGAVDVSPTSQQPSDGTIKETGMDQLTSPAGAASPYQYYVSFNGPHGLIPRQDFAATAASLATVHENLYSDSPTKEGFFNEFDMSVAGTANVLLPMDLPGHDTVYLSADTDGRPSIWSANYTQATSIVKENGISFPYPEAGQSSYVTYRPGQVATDDWNAYPLHTAPYVNLLGSEGLNTPVAASRLGDSLYLVFMPFTDDGSGHLGTGFSELPPGSTATLGGTYRIEQNGKTIASGNAVSDAWYGGSFYQGATLSAKPSVVSFTLSASRTGAPFRLSTADSTTWTWRSAHVAGGTVPAGWVCGNLTSHCGVEPLLTLNYGVAGMALDGTTAPGQQQLTVSVGHIQLAAAPRITRATVQVSFDGGKTWRAAAVTGSGGGYRARFTAPAGTDVTLRVSAADGAGGTITETIADAYATAPAASTADAATTATTAAVAGGLARPATVDRGAYRTCATARPGQARCFAIWPARVGAGTRAKATQATAPAGWGPKDIEAAYRLPVTRGSGETVAVVDAGDTPDLASYLAAYRKEYGLPPCTAASGCFREVNENGGSSPLAPSALGTGWDVETTLDVDMVSAACPRCKILVVEAGTQDMSDMAKAENAAVRLGASAVSNSYGEQEGGYAMTLAGAYDHPGHAIVVSSGDLGFGPASFPANLSTVTAVGGTELARAKNSRGWSEQVWNAAGGASASGCSAYEPKPSWQHDPHCFMRTVADVSAVAWNVAIYNAYWGGWFTVGGTSAASPLIAGVYALAGNAAKITPGYEYSRAGSLFNISTGNNDLIGGNGSTCGDDYLCVAKKGYSAPVGLGTPDGTGAF